MNLRAAGGWLDKLRLECYIAPMLRSTLTAESLPGVWTALVTPFKGGGINWAVWEELLERAVKARLTGVVVLGSTGESPSVSDIERSKLIRKAVKIARKRMFVIVGAGGANFPHVMHQIAEAADFGSDGILLVTPYYSKPTQAGLRRYFQILADLSEVPIILYHIPGRCGVGVSPALALELAEHPAIIGLKDAGGDVARVSDLARKAPPGFTILSGDDPLALPMISVGAKGVVSVVSNIAPIRVREMVDAALAGDFALALQHHRSLAPLNDAFFLETNPAPIKEAMNLAGIRVGAVRLPLAPVTSKTRNALREALNRAAGYL